MSTLAAVTDALLLAIEKSKQPASKPVSKRTRTVIHKHVLRDPVSKRMIGVREATDVFEGIVCRDPNTGNLFEMPEITTSVTKDARGPVTPTWPTCADMDRIAKSITPMSREEMLAAIEKMEAE